MNSNAADLHSDCLPDSSISRFRAMFFAAQSSVRWVRPVVLLLFCVREDEDAADDEHVAEAPEDAEDIIDEEFNATVFSIALIPLLWAGTY